MLKSRADIVQSFADYLSTRFPRADTTADRPLSSLLIDGIATELETPFAQLTQVQAEQGVSEPTVASPEGLDGLAYNWNISRRGAVASSGIVTFQKRTAPTTSLRIGAQDGSGGIILATARQQTGSVVIFKTIQTVFLTTATTVNPANGLYEVDASIECLTLGALGNVDAGLISVMQSSVAGVDSVTNKIATTGGRAEEDDVTLASRIALRSQGLQPGTQNGLVSIALAQDQVTDAVVSGPNDPNFARLGVGGAVDLIVLGEQITPSVQFSTFHTGDSSLVLNNLPATDVTSIVATVGLTQTTLVKGVDYSFSQDLVSSNALSSKSNDHISWLSGQLPNNLSTVTVSYQYDKVIPSIQAVVDGSGGHFITASPLVKRATKVLVDISVNVLKLSGFDSAVVSNNVATAISDYVNNLGLGDTVQQSNIVVAVQNAAGVDSITLPIGKLALRGNTGTSDLTMTKYQYARIDGVSLNLTVS